MRKLLLSFLVVAGYSVSMFGQSCTPDPQYTSSGVYPDSATGLAPAFVGYSYDQVITVVVPTDSTVTLFGQTQTVTINDITLTGVNGLPPNFTYACSASNCAFAGGSTGCVDLYSTQNPTSGDIGMYNLTVYVTANVITQFGPYAYNDSITYYYIDVMDSTSMGVETYNNESFKLADIYPNPVKDNAKIQFVTGKTAQVKFTVTNLLGKIVENRTFGATRGVNTLYFDTKNLSNGIYIYSIEMEGKIAAKKMIISK